MEGLSPHLLGRLLEVSPLGILAADFREPDLPIVYVSRALSELLKVSPGNLVGKGLMSLAMPEPPPPEGWMLQEQLQLGESVSLRMILPAAGVDVELRLVPLADSNDRFSHVAGYVPAESMTAAGSGTPWRVSTGTTMKLDRLTGLPSLEDFNRGLALECARADSGSEAVSVVMLRVNHYGLYLETFGEQAAASMMRLVARSVAGTLRRANDRLARSGTGEFVISVQGLEEAEVKALVLRIAERVRNLAIHHPRSTISRYVSLRSSAVRAGGRSSGEALIQRLRTRLDETEEQDLPPIPRL